MPAFPGTGTNTLTQDAVLWPMNGYDRHGKPTVDIHNPVPIRCQAQKNTDKEVKTVRATSPVPANQSALSWSVLVDRPVDLQSRIWIGKIQGLPQLVFDGKGNLLASQMQILVVTGYDETFDPTGQLKTRTATCTEFNVVTSANIYAGGN